MPDGDRFERLLKGNPFLHADSAIAVDESRQNAVHL